MYKDRLVRFGFELIEYVCKYHNVEIEVIDLTEKFGQEELKDDLIQITTDFNSKLADRRLNKVINELKEGGDYNGGFKD